MSIVAGDATHFSVAFLEATAGMHLLYITGQSRLLLFIDASSADENSPGISQRLAWSEITRSFAITQDTMFAGQVALVADAVAFPGGQLLGIYDVLIVLYFSLAVGIYVLSTGAMASFAADTGFLERLDRIVTVRLLTNEINPADMTGQAGLSHQAFEPLVSGRDITGRQVPCLILDVPGDRGLVKTFLILGKVGSATRSGTDHEGNGNRLVVNILAILSHHFLVMPREMLIL
jgi:hypothetical protein